MKPPRGSRKPRKRVGRGPGSGNGKTAGRGHKGAGARAGNNQTPGFEGGQMPMARRLPKRGFNNIHRVAYKVVNLEQLGRFAAGGVVDPAGLAEAGLTGRRCLVKILGSGSIGHALTVRAHAFSGTARAAIEKAGGTCELLAVQATTSTEQR
jgi:large subunit ribosomal protein L15